MLASFWNKINLSKFAFFDFTLNLKKKKKKKTRIKKKKKDEIIKLILRYSSGDIFANSLIPVPSHNLRARIIYSRRVSLTALFTTFPLYCF